MKKFRKLCAKDSKPSSLYLTRWSEGIKWNFTKFLVNKEGKVIARYGPRTPPLEFEKDIQNLLTSSS
nr:probable glutathione peroxidase 2 [Tanacetum cinerariifolium]